MLIVFIYFLIGFISDLVLNYLSFQSYMPPVIKALRVYFQRPSIKNSVVRNIVSGINAGLTVVVAFLITAMFAQWIFKFYQPQSLSQLFRFLLLAFPIGYAIDFFIYKTELFGPTLNPFYKIAGVGFWGAAAFIFSILVSYAVYKKVFEFYHFVLQTIV